MDKKTENIIKGLAFAIAAYGAYRILKGDKPKEALEKAVALPKKAVEEASDIVKGTAKKAEKVVGMKKKKHKKKRKTAHKGHETKKGLRQDQKLRSKETWEKSYQKKKEKKVASTADRNRIALEKYQKPFKDLSLGQCQVVNSELLIQGYKLSANEPTKKEIAAEIKEMRKEAAEHPELPAKTVKKIVKDHERMRKKK